MKKFLKTLILIITILSLIVTLISCGKLQNDDNDEFYNKSGVFEESKLENFLNYLDDTNSTGFIIQRDNEIILEKYWDDNGIHIANNIASAGKSFCSILVGIAQDKGYLSINDKITNYLGNGFSNMSQEEENLITIKNLLSMTSGLDDLLNKSYNVGENWEYSDSWNLLFNILEIATGKDINTFANEVLFSKIGIEDAIYKSSTLQLRILRKSSPEYKNWSPYQLYCSTRDMIKFGQLMLQNGKWDGEQIVSEEYLESAIVPSSTYNPAYGYLFWLNSEDGAKKPNGEIIETNMIPNAPRDTYCALGMGDKKIYIVPSYNLVIARQGSYDSILSFASTAFDNELWEQINILLSE